MMMQMKNYFWILLLLVFSCKKGDIELQSTEIGIDPVANKNALQKTIQLKGHFYDGLMPVKTIDPRVSLQLVAPIDTIEIGNETPAFIPLLVPDQGFFKMRYIYFSVSGADGYWKVPAQNDSISADYFMDLIVPKLVKEGKIRVKLCAELFFRSPINPKDSLKYFTDTVSVLLDVKPPIPCGGDPIIGSAGLTILKFEFGDKKGRVNVKLLTGNIGDRMDVKFGGKYVISTCTPLLKSNQYPKCSSPASCFLITGIQQNEFFDFYFDYDPKISRYAEVYVMGYCNFKETLWSVKMSCAQ